MNMLEQVFNHLEPMPDDPILGLNDLFKKDERPEKVNLGVGCYLNEAGNLPLLDVVEEAEGRLAARKLPHGYMPMSGIPKFCEAVKHLVFGEVAPAVTEGRITTVQTLGGTGALQLGAAFARQYLGVANAVVSDPTWGNHIAIFKGDGLAVTKYPYLNAAKDGIDFEAMTAALEKLDEGTLVLMHACCHNPTGLDLTHEEWRRVLEIVKARGLLPMLDMAYQGFGDGLEEDAYAIRLFADSGIHFLAATSCSKNFALYGERVGALHVVCADKKEADTATTILKALVRAEYSNPPAHGANVVAEVLADAELLKAWKKDVVEMHDRICEMRRALAEAGSAEGADLSFATKQKGMFSFTGLSPEEMDRLREEFAVYGVRNGRICVAGLNHRNVTHVAKSIAAILKARS